MKNISNPFTSFNCQEVVLSSDEFYLANSPSLAEKNAIANNPNNPFDFVGQIHNEYCVAILSKLSVTNDRSLNTFRSILMNFFGLNNANTSYFEELFDYNYQAIKTKSTNYHPDIMQVLNSNPNFRNFDCALNNIINNNRLGYMEKVNEIIMLEKNVHNFSQTERSLIYQVGSVARYSTYLWNTLNWNHGGKPVVAGSVKANHVIATDYVNLWVGGIFGGPVGGLGAMVTGSVACAVYEWLT